MSGKLLSFPAILVSIVLMSLCLTAQAQITKIEPATPRWGQELTVSYNPSAESASFKAEDQVYLFARVEYPDRVRNFSVRMAREGALFIHKYRVDGDASSIGIHFLTLNGGWDEQAFISTMVYRADGKPARGALSGRIGTGRSQDYFRQELELYPDCYSAWARKWALDLAVGGERAVKAVNSEVWKLGGQKRDNPELLYALAFGHIILGREEESRKLVRQLFDNHPESGFTARALTAYEEELAAHNEKAAPEILALKMRYLEKFPRGDYARAASSSLCLDQRAPLELIEQIARRWMADEPDNPLPYFNLAQAYRNQYRNYDDGVGLAEKAIRLLIEGRMRLYGDINGHRTARMLPEGYVIVADLEFRRNRYEDALAAARASQSASPESEPSAYLLEGRILENAGNDRAAEIAFLEAWRRGSQEAEEHLKRRYKLRRGDLAGFDEYLLSGRSAASMPSVVKRPAPNFRATSLDGKSFELSQLRGKIVVLNLWFIACGPCRREIPKLNEIAAEFGKSPVVFLAPSFDDAEALKAFLKTTRFDYHIVPDAEDLVVGKFNATLFPTHIIIDGDGQIETVLVGAAPRRPEEVRRELLRLLGK